jgi:hypothetical protein
MYRHGLPLMTYNLIFAGLWGKMKKYIKTPALFEKNGVFASQSIFPSRMLIQDGTYSTAMIFYVLLSRF